MGGSGGLLRHAPPHRRRPRAGSSTTRRPQSHPLESHLQRACKAAVACAVPTSFAAEAAAGHAGELRPEAGREGAVGEGSAVLCPWEEAA